MNLSFSPSTKYFDNAGNYHEDGLAGYIDVNGNYVEDGLSGYEDDGL